MDESIDYGAVFGIDEGGNEQEAAEPANDDIAQGENEQETAEPAEGEMTREDDSGDAAEDDKGADTEDIMAPRERARFAAARRKAEAERDAAIKEAQEEAKRTIDEVFKSIGLQNPYTNKPITTKEEYEEYRRLYRDERKSQLIQRSGMTDDEFSEFVASLPEVQEAKRAQREAEQTAKIMRQQQAKAKIDEQLKEIAAIDPSIKELKDITKMDTYPRFNELVQRGNDFVDAFKLANIDMLTNSAAAASKQAAINAARSKDHLNRTSSRGAGAVSVPTDIKEAYRAFNPNATDAEIQQHYNKYMKNN